MIHCHNLVHEDHDMMVSSGSSRTGGGSLDEDPMGARAGDQDPSGALRLLPVPGRGPQFPPGGDGVSAIAPARDAAPARALALARPRAAEAAAVCCLVAGAIHLAVFPDHASEWWAYGVFFAGCAVWQTVFGLLVWSGRRPRVAAARGPREPARRPCPVRLQPHQRPPPWPARGPAAVGGERWT